MSDIAAEVDAHVEALLMPADPALAAALTAARAAGLPAIEVSAAQGRLLSVLARGMGASRILEIGTLAGYSAICLARALPAGGMLVTLESDPAHAAVARKVFAESGLGDRIDLVEGDARQTLAGLAGLSFDMVFIDADKPSYARYLEAAVGLTRRGGMIIADNVVRAGAVLAPQDPKAHGAAAFIAALARHQRLQATIIQTVGSKGHDGFAIAVVD